MDKQQQPGWLQGQALERHGTTERGEVVKKPEEPAPKPEVKK